MSVETIPTPVEILSPSLLDLPIRLKDGSSTTVAELLALFDSSHYAAWMRTEQKFRFHERYGYDREAMLADLGPDVSPTGHHHETLQHAIAIIERERAEGTLMGEISDEDLAVGLFAIGIHDLGECEHPELLLEPGVTRLVGDIPAGNKTPEDRAAEAAVRHALYRKLYSHIDPFVIKRAEAIISHEDDSILHYLFEGAHRASTLQTVIKAKEALFKLDHADDDDHPITPERTTALHGIATYVRDKARDDVKQMPWYAHLRKLYNDTEGQVVRHTVTKENLLYHQH